MSTLSDVELDEFGRRDAATFDDAATPHEAPAPAPAPAPAAAAAADTETETSESTSTALDVALALIAQGFSPVPVAFMGKAPTDIGGRRIAQWQKLRVDTHSARAHFPGGPQNIGVVLGEPSKWLTDIDCDWPEAIIVAARLLPTTRRQGRPSALESHHFFLAPDSKTKPYKDPTTKTKNTIIEIRSTGAQTVIAGSTHVSGEAIEWSNPDAEIAKIDARELELLVSEIAAASLFARHWVGVARCGEAAGALYGALLAEKWDETRAERFVHAVLAASTEGKSPEIDREADPSWDRVIALLPDDGGPVVTCARAWLGLVQKPTGRDANGTPKAAPKSIYATPEDEPPALRAITTKVRIQRATAYLSKIPRKASGDGSSQLIKVAGLLVRGFALGEGRASDLLATSELANGWTREQINTRCRDAAQAADRPPYWGAMLMPREDEEEDSEDRVRLLMDDKSPRRIVANVLSVIASPACGADLLCYDEFREAVIVSRQPPCRECDRPQVRAGVEWVEEDSTRFGAWLSEKFDLDVSNTIIGEAVEAAARKRVINPVRDYLRSLKWDGVPRLDAMLSTHFGAHDNAYTRGVGPRWMIAAVARVERPGCQVDTTVILEGPQGIGKTSAFRMLVPDPTWYADSGIHIGDKDSYQNLRGVWIYGLDELDALKRGERTRTKNFLTQTIDRYRPSYGRRARAFVRRNVFCGTTNEEEYLSDRTGNRRYWPVSLVRETDVARIAQDRDQLWAEAVARFDAGEKWHADTAEFRSLCEAEQTDRVQRDAWEPIIAAWLVAAAIDTTAGVLTSDILLRALLMPRSDFKKADEMRVTEILKGFGFIRGPKHMEHGQEVRRYIK